MTARVCDLALGSAIAAIAWASGAGAEDTGPKKVPLTSLATAEISVEFTGTIKLTGETKHLVYTQPLPADDDGQDIVEVNVAPHENLTHEIVEDGESRQVQLTWTDPPAGELVYDIEVVVGTHAFDRPVKDPKKGKDKASLKSGKLTKPSKEIKKTAKEVTEGAANDLDRVLRIAHWIHENIEYDLGYSQAAADKAVPAVMKAGRGTCDEISHLFISMARSAGIPAREVSGLAFTGDTWGFHSWSEVLLGDRWVPVDATNMQIGFVDATHVAFARDLDDARFQQNIESLGTGMFSVLDHGMDVGIVRATTAGDLIKARVVFDPETVPPGFPFTTSLVLENPSNSWFAGPVRMVIPTGFQTEQPLATTFLLGPNEKKNLDWAVATPPDPGDASTYWYRLGAVMFPYLMAAGDLTIASGLVGEVAAFQDAGGKAVVAVGIENPLGQVEPAQVRVCLFDGWEPEGEGLCYESQAQVSPDKPAKLEWETEYVIGGNFSIVVEATLGGLDDEMIHKVNVSQ